MAVFCGQEAPTFFNPFLFDWGPLWFNQPTKSTSTSNDTDTDDKAVTSAAASPTTSTPSEKPAQTASKATTVTTEKPTRAQTTSDVITMTTEKSANAVLLDKEKQRLISECGRGNPDYKYLYPEEEREEQEFKCNILLRSRLQPLVNVSKGDALAVPDIQCSPVPDAFNPCEDLMGSWWLRVAVWIVFIVALVMNLFVLLVARFSSKAWMDQRVDHSIERLLITNLVSADLCLAIFLGVLAAVDALTFGDYAKTAIYWQQGTWCNAAGFLSLFGMQLSVLILVLVNVERLHTIAFRLTPGGSSASENRLMLFMITLSWVYSAVIAIFPMVGFSSYNRVAICLPFEAESSKGHAFLTFLLISNGVFAFIVMIAYCGIIWTALKSQSSGRTELRRLARNIFIIVFVDFSCWLPIAVVGLSALYGNNLISTSSSKIFLVFVYPINCLANPILYAILLKHFREHIFDFLHKRLHVFNKAYNNRRKKISLEPLFKNKAACQKSKPSSRRTSLYNSVASTETKYVAVSLAEKTTLVQDVEKSDLRLANVVDLAATKLVDSGNVNPVALNEEVEMNFVERHQASEVQSVSRSFSKCSNSKQMNSSHSSSRHSSLWHSSSRHSSSRHSSSRHSSTRHARSRHSRQSDESDYSSDDSLERLSAQESDQLSARGSTHLSVRNSTHISISGLAVGKHFPIFFGRLNQRRLMKSAAEFHHKENEANSARAKSAPPLNVPW